MNRRDFLRITAKTAAGIAVAPAIVRSESLMGLWVPPEREIVLPDTLK